MSIIIVAVIIVAVAFTIEYLTRGLPQPLRWIILGVMVVLLLLWLAQTLGLV